MRSRRFRRLVSANPVLTGAVAIAAILAAVFVSYNASRGLPFVPTYSIDAAVGNAELLDKGSDVRIGGALVGHVTSIEAEPARGGRPPYARLALQLDADLANLPADTQVRIRPTSILGAKYVELRPGTASRTIPPGGTIPRANFTPSVELTDLLDIVDRRGARGIRGTIGGLGNALAGRGGALNATIAAFRTALPPAGRVLRVLAAPDTDLAGLIRGAAATAGALAPVSASLGRLIDGTGATFEALDAPHDGLGRAIAALPPAERTATRALGRLGPVLDDAAAIARDARPGVHLFPQALPAVDRALRAGTPVLRRTPALGTRLSAALAALDRLARAPATPVAVRELDRTVASLGDTLAFVNPAQTHCNVAVLFARNFGATISEGDAIGPLIRVLLTGVEPQVATPDSDLHINPYPHENEQECEAGREPYLPGQHIGNPPGLQDGPVPETRAPAQARARARRAGLLRTIPGAAG